MSEEELEEALRCAVVCCILAAAGPQRSRVLANLYKDERSAPPPRLPLPPKGLPGAHPAPRRGARLDITTCAWPCQLKADASCTKVPISRILPDATALAGKGDWARFYHHSPPSVPTADHGACAGQRMHN